MVRLLQLLSQRRALIAARAPCYIGRPFVSAALWTTPRAHQKTLKVTPRCLLASTSSWTRYPGPGQEMSKETDSLLPCTGRLEHPERPPRRTWPRVGLVALVLTLCALLYTRTSTQASVDLPKLDTLVDAWTGGTEDLCPQHAPYVPEGTAAGAGATALAEPRASELAQLLSGAVQVDTSVGDAWPPVRDAPGLWDSIFAPFRMYLASALPALHAAESPIKLTRVNEHGLLYTWTGTNTQLGPLLLMAHQDVVPVEPSTWGAWAYPPFSGHITEEGNIFGRGTEDTKSSLVTILAALQSLLQANWTPQRTILVSFGFDEEAAGTEGAGALARHIESVYGPGSIAMLIDEGGEFTLPDVDAGVPATASPAVSEKGYLDVSLTVATPGGHSSVPPVHTGIGLLAQAVVAVEAHADDAVLRSAPGSGPEHSHGWDELLCGVAFGKIRGPLKRALLRLHYAQLHPPSDGVPRGGYEKMLNVLRAQALDLMDPHQRVLFTTTQAVDLIAGGVKVRDSSAIQRADDYAESTDGRAFFLCPGQRATGERDRDHQPPHRAWCGGSERA